MTDAGEDAGAAQLAPARQPTGDRAVDEVLEFLDTMTQEPLDLQIEGGERAHRVLQGRLADLGLE